jgi:hypothetical protein
MKFLRRVAMGFGVATTLLFSTQVAKADWNYVGEVPYYYQTQVCQWYLTSYDYGNKPIYQMYCPPGVGSSSYSQSIVDSTYFPDSWYQNSYFNNGYNQRGFSFQFGNSGLNLPFIFHNGGYRFRNEHRQWRRH